MAKIFIGSEGYKISLGTQKIKLAYLGDQRVYSAGNIVTYIVDTEVTYREEIDNGSSCLSPITFIPGKTGWTFIGWRDDNIASESVLTEKIMGDTPVILYAVFRQEVILTYYNGSTTPSTKSGYRIYNNGNITNPTTALAQSAISGWNARGWSISSTANAGVSYANGSVITMDSNMTLYGLYYQTITLTLVTPNGTTNLSNTRYYNSSSDIINPTFTPTVPTISGWTIRGWSTSTSGNANVVYLSGVSFTLTTSTTLYAMYYQTITLTIVANSVTSSQSGIRYYNSSSNVVNPTFTVANPAKTGATFIGWSADGSTTVVNSNITGLTLDASTTRYAVFKYADASAPALVGTFIGAGSTGGHESEGVKTLIGTVDGNCYAAVKLEVTASMVCGAYWISNHGWVSINNVELRHCFKTGATEDDPEPWQQEVAGYPCSNGAKAVITVNLTTGSNAINIVNIGVVSSSSCQIFSATLMGRTVVG